MSIGFSENLFSRNKNKIRRAVGFALVTVMLCCMTGDLHAATYTNASIQNKQNELAGAKEQVAELKGSLTDVQRVKDELESKKSDLDAYITQLDAQLTDMSYQ